ncbi:MAG TPA: GNAT family N-acetyltransferase [Candidatus Binatia bacterium]|nr:GNAT family N-acetyltransferase [Candidatus Binatia bacterium]
MTRTDVAAHAAEIPGLVIRPYAGEVDLPEMVRIQNAEWEADGLDYRETVAEQAAWLSHPSEQFDAARDSWIAEVDGRMVGHARRDWVDATDGVREYRGRGAVDPAWRRRGIGRALAEHGERQARQLAAAHETDRPRVLGTFTEDRNAGALALAERLGYESVRWFFDMERPGLDRDLPELVPLPEGIEVRPVETEHLRAIWQADIEAFRDHWGGHDESEEAFLRFRDSPAFEPSLWVVAWDGNEVVAASVNAIYTHENEAVGRRRGWLESVFTRRAWRKRGIAGAVIARSLHLFAQRRMDTAALGVDADNPTGALRLYESFGFAVTERGRAWRKPMEPAP